MACGHLHETPWAAWGCQLLGITPHADDKRRHRHERVDEDDSHHRPVEPLKQNTHRSATRASTSSSCLARWPPPSMKNVYLLIALPGHPAIQSANDRACCCMQAAVQEALPLSTRPVHVFGGSFHPRCSNRSAIGLPRPLATLRAERTELAGCRSSWAGAPAYGGSCLVSLRDAHNCHRSPRDSTIPSCQSCVNAKLVARLHRREKRQQTLAPPRWSQARYSSELRTDGAGSVTPSGSHRSSRARRTRRAYTVGTQLSLHAPATTQ